jgi:hypothetical protein
MPGPSQWAEDDNSRFRHRSAEVDEVAGAATDTISETDAALERLRQHNTSEPDNERPPPRKKKWFADTRAYLTGIEKVQAERDEEKVKVARLEEERRVLTRKCSQYKVDLDYANAQLAQFKTARDKERVIKAAAQQTAWDKEKADYRLAEELKAAQRARVLRDQKAREEAENARETAQKALDEAKTERLRTQSAAQKLADLKYKRLQDAKADYFNGVFIERSAADDQLESDLTAQVEAEAAAEAERVDETQKDRRSEIERERDDWERRRWG